MRFFFIFPLPTGNFSKKISLRGSQEFFFQISKNPRTGQWPAQQKFAPKASQTARLGKAISKAVSWQLWGCVQGYTAP